jgi:ADP-L-glycero-D-manno-heptose 6-epimerase
MILVTGGSGFIGSNLHAALTADGQEVAIADWLGHDNQKWRNLYHHPPAALIEPERLDEFLAHNKRVTTIVHLGAIAETTATDADLIWRTNVTMSQNLWTWCAEHHAKFIYASSASTYGNGSAGFDDDMSLSSLQKLRPLNLYGWSKHAFDLWVARQVADHGKAPLNWAGVKFFNVFGPNEYHKGKMISVVKVKHDEIMSGGPARLFKSDQPGLPDGEQKRDFIYIDDVVAGLKFMINAQNLSGIYNLGTGTARSYMDLARAVCTANDLPERITFVDMPAALRGQYQSFTQAPMARLRALGFNHRFMTLEEGIRVYVQNHLRKADPYK